jgi:hypothetical protein
MTSRIARILVSILLAAAIVASPAPYLMSLGASLLHHPSNHLLRKHQQVTLVAKARTALAASARFASAREAGSRPRTAKRLSSPATRPGAFGPSSALAGLRLVFRPLRC